MKKTTDITSASVLSGARANLVCALVLALCCLASVAGAQEALQNAAYGRSAAEDRAEQLKNQDYTFKYGDFRLLATPYAGMQWNDNVNLSQTNRQDDFIAESGVRLSSSYPVTEQNILFLDISVGYDRYLKNPDYSTFDLNSTSGSGLSFDIGVKDVSINLHDWFNYTQDAAQNSAVANTATYGTFRNTAGIAATWNLNQAALSGGYDYQYVRSTSADFDNINHSAQLLFLRSTFAVRPNLKLGLEATAAFTTYEQDTLNNNDAYTAGLFGDYSPSEAMKISLRGGFSTYQFKGSSASVATSDQNGGYADLNFSHQITEAIAYSVNAGHSIQLGIQSDLTEITYVRPNISWAIIKDWDINTGFFYEHGNQGIGNIVGNVTEIYDWYGGSLTVDHQFSKHFSGSAFYRLTLRHSNTPDNGYNQNLIGLQVNYRP